jgi:uncharacterized protein (DUF983 family)
MPDERAVAGPTPARVALKGLCPRCAAPTLFSGWISFAPKCSACGLDFSAFNVGDGPAAFLTLIIGAIVVAMAVTLELSLEPPWWVHVLLWLPITAGGVILSLRGSKGALLALEYRNKAREVRNEDAL